MTIRDNLTCKIFINNVLDKLANINQWRKDFIVETFTLFLSIRGRINFLQLARYGKHKEQRYRQQFEKPFDFLTFNKELTLTHGGGRYAILQYGPGFRTFGSVDIYEAIFDISCKSLNITLHYKKGSQ